jgi:membrane protein YqaA with SNARE-associated domain
MEWIEPSLVGLFFATFLAATVLPFSSEAVLTGMLITGYDPWSCLIVATVGNTIGGMSSYGLGWLGDWHRLKKWLRVKEEDLLRWQQKINRYGAWMALLCWLPFVGDPLAIALGFFRTDWRWVFVLMTTGKFARYLLLLYAYRAI